MKIIRTNESKPESLTDFEREAVYNGLDCCVTLEVHEVIHPQLGNHSAGTYNLSRELQGPVLEMRLRGILVDQLRKIEVIDEFYERLDRLETQLDRLVLDGVGMASFNWRSTKDLQELFYGRLQIPPIRYAGRVTVDRAARDRLEQYLIARPLVRHLNLMADLGKKITVLRTAIDPDGRIRTSYNIAGTSTGRFSSSVSEFGTGGNLQNVEEALRSVFIADPGMKLAKFDAKSGESYCVGAIEYNLFGDATYLDGCESGDLHTAAARLCWPNLGWVGNIKADKAIAEQPFYRHHSYRQTSKKLGHASNYAGLPPTIATQTGMPQDIVEQFQPKYFRAYPAHRRWHLEVERQIAQQGYLISLMGRKRHFLGRRNEPATLREAIAYDPQGSLADIVNTGMLNVWNMHIPGVQLLQQDHDATTWQYPEERETEVVPLIQRSLALPVMLKDGRTMTIPYDCKVGWNRGDFDEKNPNKNPEGLKDYAGSDTRRRKARPGLLDIAVRDVHLKHRKPRAAS